MFELLRSRAITLVTIAMLGAGLAIAVGAPPAAAEPASVGSAPVTQDALPTAQVNGVVWGQAVAGNTVYVTGKFTSARPAGSPAGSNETPRANILAYDIRTGVLSTTFVHTLNGQGQNLAVSPDGKRLYVVGSFTTVDGKARSRIAAFDTATGALLSWAPQPNSTVYGVTATNDAVYFGGVFNAVGAVARTRAAAVSTSGALLPWSPNIDNIVRGLAMVPGSGRVYLGGHFRTVNGATVVGFAGVDDTTGASVPTAAATQIRSADGTTSSGVLNLRADTQNVYGVSFNSGAAKPAALEGSFAVDAASGSVSWINNCYGDSYDATPVGGAVFVASHAHNCAATGDFPDSAAHYFGLAWSTQPSDHYNLRDPRAWNYMNYKTANLLQWNPTFTNGKTAGQSVWSFAGNNDYVAAAGEFPTVNGVAQQGLVRFARHALAPNKFGPSGLGTPTATISSPTDDPVVTVSTTSAYDPDDGTLTYSLIRDGDTSRPIASTAQHTVGFWQQASRPQVALADTSPVAGSHTYQIGATDGSGNKTLSAGVTLTTPGSTNQPPTAAFTSTTNGLQVSVDASGSTAANPISSYAWTFGDGSSGTGRTTAHPYAASGSYVVTLTVTDAKGLSSSKSATVTVAAANVAPTASFASTSTGLLASLDASASDDPDGTLSGYDWKFGDGNTATGSTTTHAYAKAGSYPVTLTVTDNRGAQNSVTRTVTVVDDTPVTVARDAFARSTASGWGTADAGGAWTTGSATRLAVANGVGTMTLPGAGVTNTAVLSSVSQGDVVASVDFTTDKAATGGGYQATVIARRTGTSEYRVTARLTSTNTVTLGLTKIVSGVATGFGEKTISGLTYAPGDSLTLRLTVTSDGASSNLTGTVWRTGTTPPAAQRVASDDTAVLQGAGAVGISNYIAASATDVPVVGRFDNFVVTNR